MRKLGSLIRALIILSAVGTLGARANAADIRELQDTCDVYPAFPIPCSGLATYINAESAYLRYSPGWTAFDYVTKQPGLFADEVVIHQRKDEVPSVLGGDTVPYLCVTATATSGAARTVQGWVDARCVCVGTGVDPNGDGQPCPDTGALQRKKPKTAAFNHRPQQVPCRVTNPAGADVRVGPGDDAPPVVERFKVVGKKKVAIPPHNAHVVVGDYVGWQTSPGTQYGAATPYSVRPPTSTGFVYVMQRYFPSRKVRRGGWIKLSDLCCANPLCAAGPTNTCSKPKAGDACYVPPDAGTTTTTSTTTSTSTTSTSIADACGVACCSGQPIPFGITDPCSWEVFTLQPFGYPELGIICTPGACSECGLRVGTCVFPPVYACGGGYATVWSSADPIENVLNVLSMHTTCDNFSGTFVP